MGNITDVARLAGVSISTVSNALNGSKYVSPALRARVEAAAAQANYQANPFARGMKRKQSREISVILSTLDSTFFPQVVRGIEEATGPAGYEAQFYHTGYDFEREQAYVRAALTHNVDGILLNSVAPMEAEAYFSGLGCLENAGKPIAAVSMERDLTYYGLDSVCADNAEGAFLATKHLLALGCRRLAHIAGPMNFAPAQERLDGFERAMREAGLPPRVLPGDFSPESGYQSARAALASDFPPDGLFCANDQMAVGALKAFSEAGVPVPGRARVVGFDDTFIATLLAPPLSTIHASPRDMGHMAAARLLERLEKNEARTEPARLLALPVRLVARASTDASARSEWSLKFR